MTIKEIWEMPSTDFIPFEETIVPSGKLTPYIGKQYKEGDIRYHKEFEDLEILKSVNTHDILFREPVVEIIEHPTTKLYIKWIKEGHIPPPITVTKPTPYGNMESLNRRRLYALQQCGIKETLAWQFIGNRVHILKQAIKEGKPVPEVVLKDYPYLTM